MYKEVNFCQQDTLILGAVGSNRWRGALMEYKNGKIRQIEDPLIETDSYLGMRRRMPYFYLVAVK